MQTKWNDAHELAVAIEERVLCGHKRIVLTPATALWFAREIQAALRQRHSQPLPSGRDMLDVYATGSRVLELSAAGDIVDVVAWARSTITARTAFDYLCGYEPNKSFEQRRKSWVEAERPVAARK